MFISGVTLDRSSSTSLSGSRNISNVGQQNSGRCRSCEPVVRRIFWRQHYIHTWAVYTLFINIGGDDSSFSVAILKWIIIERWHHEREERLAESLGVLLKTTWTRNYTFCFSGSINICFETQIRMIIRVLLFCSCRLNFGWHCYFVKTFSIKNNYFDNFIKIH